MEKPKIVEMTMSASFLTFLDENGDAEKKVIMTHKRQGDYPEFQAIWLIGAEKLIIESCGSAIVTVPTDQTTVNGESSPSFVFDKLLTLFGLD